VLDPLEGAGAVQGRGHGLAVDLPLRGVEPPASCVSGERSTAELKGMCRYHKKA
jgi:hypothetical protein